MRLPALLASSVLLAVAVAAHRVPLFKQRTKTIDRPNPKFNSLLASARNDPTKFDGMGWDQNIYDYVVDCALDSPLTLTTDGGELAVPPAAFTRRRDANRCVLDVYQDVHGETGEVLVGTEFFASFCGVFDYASQRFGYAAIS
ncbi:hypothetical protein M3Y99_00134900 [Aphelenchoides fujianensis]|nr:hypothetical protein M3Y99_00134900 [Aphelenchoides fujianensis]